MRIAFLAVCLVFAAAFGVAEASNPLCPPRAGVGLPHVPLHQLGQVYGAPALQQSFGLMAPAQACPQVQLQAAPFQSQVYQQQAAGLMQAAPFQAAAYQQQAYGLASTVLGAVDPGFAVIRGRGLFRSRLLFRGGLLNRRAVVRVR